MKKHILYSDLDGTLVIGDEKNLTISKTNQIAIQKWVEDGNYFSVATGRTILQAKRIIKDLVPLNLPLVLANGAVVYDNDKDQILYQDVLDKDIINDLLKILKTRNDTILVLTDPYRYYAILPEDKTNIPELYFECEITDYDKISHLSFIKVILYVNGKNISEVMNFISDLPLAKKVNIFQSSNAFIEIVNKDTNKGFAIREALKHFDYPFYNLYAIGDYHNDIDMLKFADVSAAPYNAHPEVKMIADLIVNSHDEDAVAHFISKLIIIKEVGL